MENPPVKTDKQNQSLHSYVSFGIKSAIVACFAYFVVNAAVEDALDTLAETIRGTRDQIISQTVINSKKVLHDELGVLFSDHMKVRLKGFLSANPAAHYRLADFYEKNGSRPLAIEEMELAVGLLEMHSSNKSVLDRYQKRLKDLRDKEARTRS